MHASRAAFSRVIPGLIVALAAVYSLCPNAMGQVIIGDSYVTTWPNGSPAALSITWDDSAWDRVTASKIMDQYGLKGTFNVFTSRLDPANPNYMPTLRTAFIGVAQHGHELGNHTVDHIDLADPSHPLTPDQVTYEVSAAKAVIEQMTGVPCVTLAYPYGHTNASVKAIAAQYAISSRVSSPAGINQPYLADYQAILPLPRPGKNETWTNDQFVANYRQNVINLVNAGGWGLELYHNLSDVVSDANTASVVTTPAFSGHLWDLLTNPVFAGLWIAPEGAVARYAVERSQTFITTTQNPNNHIQVDLAFDGDLSIFNQPLTIVTAVADSTQEADLIIQQDGEILPFTLFTEDGETFVRYNALLGAGSVDISAGPPHGSLLPGDANGDNIVDTQDFTILKDNFGHTGGLSHGDFNSDGVIDTVDFTILKAHFGEGQPAGAIPEPASASILMVGLAAAALRRRAR